MNVREEKMRTFSVAADFGYIFVRKWNADTTITGGYNQGNIFPVKSGLFQNVCQCGICTLEDLAPVRTTENALICLFSSKITVFVEVEPLSIPNVYTVSPFLFIICFSPVRQSFFHFQFFHKGFHTVRTCPAHCLVESVSTSRIGRSSRWRKSAYS